MNQVDQDGSALRTPAAPAHPEVLRGLQEGPHHGRRNQPSQRAALNQGTYFPNQRIVTPVVAHQDSATGGIGQFGDPPGRLEGIGNGLFDQEADALGGADLRHGQVGPVGSGHNGPLGMLFLQQGGEVAVKGNVKLLGHPPAPGIQIADPDQGALRLPVDQPDVFAADQSGAHHRQLHRFHIRLLSLYGDAGFRPEMARPARFGLRRDSGSRGPPRRIPRCSPAPGSRRRSTPAA